jgi:hypothetical protein
MLVFSFKQSGLWEFETELKPFLTIFETDMRAFLPTPIPARLTAQ